MSGTETHTARDHRTATWLVLGFIIAQLVVWTLVPSLTTVTLPLDVIREGLSWGREWQWGYHKHPPLVSWLANGAFVLLGKAGPYFLAQICVTMTLWFAFLVAKQHLPARLAALSTLLLTGVYYFSWPTPEFNHNVAQMPVWAGAIYIYTRVVRWHRAADWIALGVMFGLGVLTKYSVLVLALVMLLHLVSDPRHRAKLLSWKPFVGLAFGLVPVAPHVLWLLENDFQTLRYIEDRSGAAGSFVERVTIPLDFALTQAFDHLPMVLVLATGGLFLRNAEPPVNEAAPSTDPKLLLALGLGPLALTCLVSMVTGSGLRDMWGAPMFSLSGLLAVYALRHRITQPRYRRTAISACVLFLVVAIGFGLYSLKGGPWSGKPLRTDWPAERLSAALQIAFAEETGCPLRIVAGENWLAGLVAAEAPVRPSVWIDGDLAISPWISQARLEEHGALVVWRLGPDASTHSLQKKFETRTGFRARDPLTIDWGKQGLGPPLLIGWGVLPPVARCRD